MGDDIYEHWADNDSVKIIHFLDDIGNPLSCANWGHEGELYIPSIVDDGELYPVRDLFQINANSESQYPITIFIDHTRKVFEIYYISLPFEFTNDKIQEMLDAI